jgi:hypothetical protein
MADCELLAGCIFFNNQMKDMPSMADLYKKNFCRGDASQCARYVMSKAVGRENVPEDLFPNQMDRAKKLLE